MPKTAQPLDTPNPVVDDNQTLEEMAKAAATATAEVTDDATTTKDWEKPFQELAENQKSLMETIRELTTAVAESAKSPRYERVVEKEVARPEPVQDRPRKWKEKVKPESAEVLEEAVRDIAAEIFGAGLRDLRENEINPALTYLVGAQEQFNEDRLAARYPDEDFGYAALQGEVRAYRQARNFQVDQETAYRQVAFLHMMEAMNAARAEDSKQRRSAKRELDDAERTTVSQDVRRATEDELDDDEKRSAALFFGGVDPKTGKPRTQREVEGIWLAHRKGAKRDQMTTAD